MIYNAHVLTSRILYHSHGRGGFRQFKIIIDDRGFMNSPGFFRGSVHISPLKNSHGIYNGKAELYFILEFNRRGPKFSTTYDGSGFLVDSVVSLRSIDLLSKSATKNLLRFCQSFIDEYEKIRSIYFGEYDRFMDLTCRYNRCFGDIYEEQCVVLNDIGNHTPRLNRSDNSQIRFPVVCLEHGKWKCKKFVDSMLYSVMQLGYPFNFKQVLTDNSNIDSRRGFTNFKLLQKRTVRIPPVLKNINDMLEEHIDNPELIKRRVEKVIDSMNGNRRRR